MELTYKKINLNDFITNHFMSLNKPTLFELTNIWLDATAEFLTSCKGGAEVIVHCLFAQNDIKIAIPLVHNKSNIISLTSFYSSVSLPYLICISTKEKTNLVVELFHNIVLKNTWRKLLIGPLSQEFSDILIHNEKLKYKQVYSLSDNYFENNILNFESYYNQRPSRLRNTIKRREKKLSSKHSYNIQIATQANEFDMVFSAYKAVYQESWKGDEYSFDFIKYVCLHALDENKLRLGILWVDNIPAAAQIWFIQKNTASIFKLAYDPKFQQFSVGSILSMALSQYVIEQDQVSEIEFGMGSEPYKKDWLSKKRQRITLQIFNQQTMYGNLAAIRYILLPKIKYWLISSFNRFRLKRLPE